jgi:transcriptional regulator with XRE-family HTH domain
MKQAGCNGGLVDAASWARREIRSGQVTDVQSPTMRRRQLGMELRRLREDAGRTIEEVAKRIRRASSTVSRMETGKGVAKPGYVRTMLDLYGVPAGSERDALLALVKDAQQKGWWSAFDDVLPADFERYLGYEGGAASLRIYEDRVIYGLLQTPEYACASISAVHIYESPDDIERRVDLRIMRQEVLAKADPLGLWVVLDEAVLRRVTGGPETMHAQLDHLLTTGMHPNINIQVMPFSRGSHAGSDGPFIIIEFPEPTDPDVVYVEGPAGNIYLEKPRDLRRQNAVFNHLLSQALTREESAEFIRTVAEEIR